MARERDFGGCAYQEADIVSFDRFPSQHFEGLCSLREEAEEHPAQDLFELVRLLHLDADPHRVHGRLNETALVFVAAYQHVVEVKLLARSVREQIPRHDTKSQRTGRVCCALCIGQPWCAGFVQSPPRLPPLKGAPAHQFLTLSFRSPCVTVRHRASRSSMSTAAPVLHLRLVVPLDLLAGEILQAARGRQRPLHALEVRSKRVRHTPFQPFTSPTKSHTASCLPPRWLRTPRKNPASDTPRSSDTSLPGPTSLG